MKKSIIITGAGRGIGAATARMFLDNGYNVGLIGRNADTLAATADGHPNALVLPCDVGVPEEVQTSFDKAVDSWGQLDILFNNAGRGSPARTIDETGIEDWLDVVRINLTGSFLFARAAFGIMRAQHLLVRRVAVEPPPVGERAGAIDPPLAQEGGACARVLRVDPAALDASLAQRGREAGGEATSRTGRGAEAG